MQLNTKQLTALLSALILSFAGLVTSCEEDETFSTDPSTRLTFSSDTVSFDTIFTDIRTISKELIVYNHSSKGVRIETLRLASGGTRGFRVNVDGESGTVFHNVEIFRKDSIFCFVDLTIEPTDSPDPVEQTDSLIFTLENGKSQIVTLHAYGQDVVIMRGETIARDTLLQCDRPIVVYDSLIVDSGVTLTIGAGTRLFFHQNVGLEVRGRLIVNGTPAEPVKMRGDRMYEIIWGIPYYRLPNQWRGIKFTPSSTGNIIRSAEILGAQYGIVGKYAENDTLLRLDMRDSKVSSMTTECLTFTQSNIRVVNCELSNAGTYCVSIIGGKARFTHCTLASLQTPHAHAVYFANVENDSIERPLHLIEFNNCIITGGNNDEVFGAKMKDSDAPFNYRFNNSLVNTVTTEEDLPFFTNCRFDNEKNAVHDFDFVSDDAGNGGSVTNDKFKDRLFGPAHFSTVDRHSYFHDLRILPLSTACELGNGKYVEEDDCPVDLAGVARPMKNPDAGCYQHVETKEEKITSRHAHLAH